MDPRDRVPLRKRAVCRRAVELAHAEADAASDQGRAVTSYQHRSFESRLEIGDSRAATVRERISVSRGSVLYMDRREFFKLSGLAAAGLTSFDPRAALAAGEGNLVKGDLKLHIT